MIYYPLAIDDAHNASKTSTQLDFKSFLCVEDHNGIKLYKSDFKEFSNLYEYIDKNIKSIKSILHENREYILYNGLLHNLYGPSMKKHNGHDYIVRTHRYFINGKLVYCEGQPCRNDDDFENGKIYFFEEITHRKSGRDVITGKRYHRKEGIDYKKHYINLKGLRDKERRNKKLNRILQ